LAANRSRRAAARKPAPRERLPVIEVDVDDDDALSAIAEQVVTAIFELTGAAATKPKKGAGQTAPKKTKAATPKKAKLAATKKAKLATTKKAKREKTTAPRSTAGRKRR
jgi:hypothetical protein